MELRQETRVGGCECPQHRDLLVAMGPDRRHPVKAGAHRAPPVRGLSALTGCRRPGRACQADKACWEADASHPDTGQPSVRWGWVALGVMETARPSIIRIVRNGVRNCADRVSDVAEHSLCP